jgi:hypothetical protein
MTRKVFISKPENYDANLQEGAEVSAGRAWLSSPAGPIPGIIVRRDNYIRFVIPAADALRLANEIADAVEEMESAA